MATNWANKYHNRWFVRVDGKGIPVYGSLISRSYNPSYGNNRFIDITACLPNQICCPVVPNEDIVITPTGTFTATTGTTTLTISNSTGVLTTLEVTNNTTEELTLGDLVTAATSAIPGFGTFTSDATTFTIVSPQYSQLTATIVYT